MTNCCDAGLWVDIGTATPALDCNLLQTSGHSIIGRGIANYVTDADQTSVVATAWRQQDAAGKWWILAEVEPTVDMFGALGDGVVDDTNALQSALDYIYLTKCPLFVTPGEFLVTTSLTYLSNETTALKSTGPIIRGAGMGHSVFLNRVEDGALLIIGRAPGGGLFTKGGEVSHLTISGDGETENSSGLSLKGAWYMTLQNLRINSHTDVGLTIGDDAAALNPDDTATSGTTIINCEFERNRGGIDNPVNNNAPCVSIINTQIRGNRQFGIWMNSSYWDIDETSSVSFNGFLDYENAAGGIIIAERENTSYSAGYRAKAFLARCELDTNYPWSLDLRQAELPVFKGGGIQFRDYPGTEITTLPQWPEGAVRVGGSTNLERCLGAKFEDVRISIVNEGLISGGPSNAIGGHPFAWLVIEPYGISVESSHHSYNLEGVTMGSDCVLIRETAKASMYYDRLLHVRYDLPVINGSSGFAASAFDVPYPLIFGAVREVVQDDEVLRIQTPLMGDTSLSGANYGAVIVSVGGQSAASDVIFYRAALSPSAAKLGSLSSDINVMSVALSGTTGPDGKYNVGVDADGYLYFENRIGVHANVQVQFLYGLGGWFTYPAV